MNEELIKELLKEIREIEGKIAEYNEKIYDLKNSPESDHINERIRDLKRDQILVSIDKQVKELRSDPDYIKLKQDIKELRNSDDSKQKIKYYKEEIVNSYEAINNIRSKIVEFIRLSM